MRVLAEREWRRLRAAHLARTRRWTEPHRRRRRDRQAHPVLDFMFTYYSFRPGRLERWHPGVGTALAGDAAEFLELPGYRRSAQGVCYDPAEQPEARSASARFIRDLLLATRDRAPRLTCFGLHEWAMVYREPRPRHEQLPLRLGAADTDRVVESLPLRCTHHDAFRFFTDPARPLNSLWPSRADQLRNEQPGCLHANMDLYKWAYKLAPATPSELVADCFQLAAEVRELDMRASPYDLSEFGHSPVRIETPAGRAEYARAQARFARRAEPLRTRLIEVAESVASVRT